ncbi:MAG: DUF692 domain-containing protein [Elstera sp.]
MTELTLAPPFAEYSVSGLPARAVGIGLRAEHHSAIGALLAEPGWALPVDFLEIHAENYLHPGSPAHRLLIDIAERAPMSVHSVGLSLGSSDGVDNIHLDRVSALVAACAPVLISDHLAWCRVDGRYLNDLLPLPYTSEALQILSVNIDRVQSRLGRKILLENPSTYLAFPESDWTEGAFITEVLKRTGCGLLLDINNIYVSAHNQGKSPTAWLESYPLAEAEEIHLAGHSDRDGVLIDTHAAPVCAEVWRLYEAVLEKIGPRPTLIEWDADLPPLATLTAEAGAARARMPG